MPAAIVLPTAAEMPNHMPSTLSKRPRLTGTETTSKVPLDAEASGVEDKSDGFGNGRVSETFGNLAMIMATGENASWKWRVWQTKQ